MRHANVCRPYGRHECFTVERLVCLDGYRGHPQPGEHLRACDLLRSIDRHPPGSAHRGLPCRPDRGHYMECGTNHQPRVQLGHLGKLGGMDGYRQHVWLCQHVHAHGGALCPAQSFNANRATMDAHQRAVPIRPNWHTYVGVCRESLSHGHLSGAYRVLHLGRLECMDSHGCHAQPGEHLRADCTAAALWIVDAC